MLVPPPGMVGTSILSGSERATNFDIGATNETFEQTRMKTHIQRKPVDRPPGIREVSPCTPIHAGRYPASTSVS